MPHKPFQEAIIEYFKKYYKKHKKAPSTRQIFKDFSKAKFYQNFPKGVAEACKIAGIPVPEASIKRMEKALQASKKKRVTEKTKQGSPWEELKESYKRDEDEHRLKKKMSEDIAKQFRKLSLDPNKEINAPVLDALEKVVPTILKRRYGITLSFWGLQKLNEITGGDLSYETVTKMAEYAKLSNEAIQGMNKIFEEVDDITLFGISEYAKLSDEEKQAVHALLCYSLEKKMSPIEAIVHLDIERKVKEFHEGKVVNWLE